MSAPMPQQPFPPARTLSRWPLLVTSALALIALVVAIVGWFRPVPPSNDFQSAPYPPAYTDQERADAKKAVCEAYEKTYAAVRSAGNWNATNTSEAFAHVVNTRLAFHAAADYLARELQDEPATAPDLANAVGDLASAYRELVLAQIANDPPTALDPLYQRIDASATATAKICT